VLPNYFVQLDYFFPTLIYNLCLWDTLFLKYKRFVPFFSVGFNVVASVLFELQRFYKIILVNIESEISL